MTAPILAGPYRAVRIDPLLLAQDVRLRRYARERGQTHHEAIGRLALLWSWQAGHWRADGPWGLSLPTEAVDALLGKGSSDVLVRVGLARWDATRPSMAIAIEPIRGAPRVVRGKRKGRRDMGVTAGRKAA